MHSVTPASKPASRPGIKNALHLRSKKLVWRGGGITSTLTRSGDPLGGGVRTKEELGAIAPVHFPFVRFGKLDPLYPQSLTSFKISAIPLATLPNEKCPLSGALLLFCGEGGIRTPGGFHLNGFRDRHIQPLCHLSGRALKSRVQM
jgi:hypothetical protein